MAKKVVASLRDTSGVKYAKLIQSIKSEKTGAYVFKEEIIMEDHIKDILAGKSQQDIIRELRAKEKEAEAAKQAQAAEQPTTPKEEAAPAAEAPKEEAPKEEAPKEEAAPAAEAPKEEAPKEEAAPAAEAPKEEDKK